MTRSPSVSALSRTLLGLACILGVSACGGHAATSSRTGRADRMPIPPIPVGYHAVTPSIVVTDVEEALDFYRHAFDARELSRLSTRSGRVIHAEMRIGDSVVMLDPEDREHGLRAPVSVGATTGALYLYVEDADAVIADAVSAGAQLVMPATDMFWGDRFGQVRDGSGHHWSIATRRFDVPRAEMSRRAEIFRRTVSSGSPPPRFEGDAPAASPIPLGYPTVTPHLVIRGVETLDYYVEAFDARITEREVLEDGTLLHAEMRVSDSVVMFEGESSLAAHARTPQHLGAITMSVVRYVPNADASFARALQAGGLVAMRPTDVFWGDRYSAIVDPSGQVWAIATRVRDVSPAALRAAAASL